MFKIISIIGARPQFVKIAPLVKVRGNIDQHIIIHTGQHYDYQMSAVFFKELGIPKPKYHLGVGSASHAEQTANMLVQIEKILLRERPDMVLVYGDTNSTIAGALAATKLHIRVAHIEAGMRSYNRRMPEEVNRVLTDHIANIHLCVSKNAKINLQSEGITENIFVVGDLMLDVLRDQLPIALKKSRILSKHSLTPKQYFLCTIHRASNTDDISALSEIILGLQGSPFPIILPAHPRLVKILQKPELKKLIDKKINIISPVGYLDMLSLENSAKAIITDSGGVQKEAYYLGVPCVTLREETEWEETVLKGWNTLVGHNTKKIKFALRNLLSGKKQSQIYGDGKTSKRIMQILSKQMN